VAHACDPSYSGGLWFEISLVKKKKKIKTLSQKYPTQKGFMEWLEW
jgi:hypothetical protein